MVLQTGVRGRMQILAASVGMLLLGDHYFPISHWFTVNLAFPLRALFRRARGVGCAGGPSRGGRTARGLLRLPLLSPLVRLLVLLLVVPLLLLVLADLPQILRLLLHLLLWLLKLLPLLLRLLRRSRLRFRR